ncbi:MAG TPA: MFS transporter [Longilinea sp.]|nr:MFS transporter [Longilinea sp.]
MDKQKTNWWQIVLVLLIGAGAVDGFMWYLYNTYIPLYLQGGNPNFVADVLGFGLTPKMVGIILVLDNIAAFILAPIIGAWSDGYRGRFGRRMPFVVATVPLAAIALVVVPFIYNGISTETSGQLGLLLPLFIPFLVMLFLILVPLAVVRTPIDALLYDLAPSKDRTKARSLGIILATLLSIGLGILGSILYDINIVLPFVLCFIVSIGLVVLGVFTIKERKGNEITAADELGNEQNETGLKRTISVVKSFPKENKRSILFMTLNIFLGMFGFSLIQAFLSSYNMTALGADEAGAGLPFLIAGGTVMVFAFPAALLANKIGRKRTMMIGTVGWAVSALLVFLLSSPVLFIPLMVLTAAFYALWFVNSFVTLIDSAPDDKTIGTMTALTGMANMAGMSIGPALTGVLIEAAGYDYGMIFITQTVVSLLAFLTLLGVKKGEMRESVQPENENVA